MAIQGVDLIIYTKDRPMQLHLLLESLQQYVTGIGKTVITMQFSAPEYEQGYRLLQERLERDEAFAVLRQKTVFAFHKRDSLEESIEALSLLGDSEYIVPLSDDAVFYRNYDLVNAEASQYFFTHPNVLSCSIRLGKNINPTVPELHKKALFERPQPGFAIETDNMLVWYWPAFLNTFDWRNTAGMCIIFRKRDYVAWFRKFRNPVWMEGEIKEELERVVFRMPRFFWRVVLFFDKVQQKLLNMLFGVYRQDILRQFFAKLLFRVPFMINRNIPTEMLAPAESVVFIPDINSTLPEIVRRNKEHTMPFEQLNRQYLEGLKISMKGMKGVRVEFSAPWDPSLKKYFQLEEYQKDAGRQERLAF